MRAQSGGHTALIAMLAPLLVAAGGFVPKAFDHGYTTYAEVLARHVRMPRVDYAGLKADRGRLDRAVGEFNSPAATGEPGWSSEQRMAFWINAYNVFTLRAIVGRYPIKGSWFLSLSTQQHPADRRRVDQGIFDWYGDDFISDRKSVATDARDLKDRAILGAVTRYGPAPAQTLARSGRARIDFLE